MIIEDIEGIDGLCEFLKRQLHFFDTDYSGQYIDDALNKAEHCFSYCTNKYYRMDDGRTRFSPLNSAQYCVLLYFLSNIAYKENNTKLASAAYLLNKSINAIDLFYEVEMPDIFAVEHPVGTVLGRARYSNRLHVSQGVTIGNNHGIYPTIGENVTVHFGAAILGNTIIGENVEIAARAYIKDESVPSNSIVFGASPNLTIKQKSEEDMKDRLTQFVYE